VSDLPIVKIPTDPDGAVRMTAEETAQLAPGAYRYEVTPRPAMSDQLRDAIADEIHTSSITAANLSADAVLAMPELQAIRKALRDMAHEADLELEDYDLPPSVVAWVMEGQP